MWSLRREQQQRDIPALHEPRTFDNRQEYEDPYGVEQTIIDVHFTPAAPVLRAARVCEALCPRGGMSAPRDVTRDRAPNG